jgi:hypothetical protein
MYKEHNNFIQRLFILSLIVELIVFFVLLLTPKSPLPNAIKNQLTSTFIAPSGTVIVNRDSASFGGPDKLLTFKATYNNVHLTFSEQPTPQSFDDLPGSYDKFTSDLGKYDGFDTELGHVDIVRVPKQNNLQAAIMNTKGTLMFIKPDKDLSIDDWRKIFKTLKIIN